MLSRRRALAIAATFLSAGATGCTDLVFGDGIQIEATAPSVSESALQSTGYEERRTREVVVEEEFEVQGESRSVRATNHQAEYDKSVDLSGTGLTDGGGRQRVATFSAITTPKAEVLGQTLNPVGEMEPAEIVNMAQERYDDFGSIQQVDETTTSILGSTATVEAFEGETEVTDLGLTVDLTLHVSEAVESGDDFALVVAGYPTAMASTERDNAFTLVDGVQHEG